MTTLRRTGAMAAVLAATILLGLVPAAADARVPHATRYRTGHAITLDTNLLSASGASAWAIDEYLRAHTSLPPLGAAFVAAERKYGINARFLLAAALHESGWGSGSIARVKHNLFGYNAYDRDPFRYASAYRTYAANIDATARFIRTAYLTPGGRWWGGAPTLRSMQLYWSSSHRWGISVSRIARSIRLASLAHRSIKFATPVVRGLLHGGERASVKVAWAGGAIPARVAFVARWVPVELDRDVAAASISRAATGVSGAADAVAFPPAASPSPAAATQPVAPSSPPTVVVARRLKTARTAIALAVAVPRAPGQYLLKIEMRDVRRGRLPAADRIAIPSVHVRVWGDRAVSYDLEPSLDGTGVIARITNTGRAPIRALPRPTTVLARRLGLQVLRPALTVTASANDPANPAPVVLVASPLVADLAPGASISILVPEIGAETGRTTNWVSVNLSVQGDASWLAAYPPIGAVLSDAGLGPSGPSAPWLTPPDGSAASEPPTTPTAQPTPTPTPAPKPTPKPVTRKYSEHSGAITYRGSWADASQGGYIGGKVAWSRSPGSSATFTFTGSTVSWLGPLGPTRGVALVLLDGRAVARVNLWRASFVARAVLFKHTFRASGRHVLKIEVLSTPGHSLVAIDGFVVRS